MVHWASLNPPLERKLQMGAMIFYILTGPLFMIPLGFFLCIVTFPYLWPITLLYFIWYIFFDPAPTKGGRPLHCVRRLIVWRYFKDYFPIELVKTTELDPSKTYLFGYHPHGIIGIGAFTNFSTLATDFDKHFPGITLRLTTLKSNFYFPVFREWALSLGVVDVSKESCDYNLSKGNSIMILVGGAAEALDAHPGTNDITIKNRKGFIRVALQNGASLVPVFGFGENNLWEQVNNEEGTALRKLQVKLKDMFGVSFPLFHGRGLLNYDFGLLPQRRAIHSVVGAPIDVPKIAQPTNEEIDKWHSIYVQALKKLYDEYKDKYDKDRKRELVIK